MNGRLESERRVVGRYVLYEPIAAGGMATVHFGRLQGPVGFARTVAIKRLHPHLACDPEFVAMFLDEARLAARIRHPNVVGTLDVVATNGEVLLVMDYVQGESLAKIITTAARAGQTIPLPVTVTIFANVLEGLHAAHEARTERGEPLEIVHRDVSPQNIIVGVDGTARVLDFGVAKATNRLAQTTEGNVKGKFSYMSPEQILQQPVDRRTDVFAASSVLWETLTGRKLFAGDLPAAVIHDVVHKKIPPPSSLVGGIPPALDEVVMRGLRRSPAERWGTAHQMALELERAVGFASALRVAEWLGTVAGAALSERARHVADIESDSSSSAIVPDLPRPAAPNARVDAAAPTPGASGQTNVTMLTGVGTTRRSGAGTFIGVGIGAVALGAIAATLIVGGRSSSGDAAGRGAAASTEVSVPTLVVSSSTPASTAPGSATAVSNEPLVTVASSSASAKGGPSARPAASSPIAVRRSPVTGPRMPLPPRVDCDNPFIIDATGKKKPKPGCF